MGDTKDNVRLLATPWKLGALQVKCASYTEGVKPETRTCWTWMPVRPPSSGGEQASKSGVNSVTCTQMAFQVTRQEEKEETVGRRPGVGQGSRDRNPHPWGARQELAGWRSREGAGRARTCQASAGLN